MQTVTELVIDDTLNKINALSQNITSKKDEITFNFVFFKMIVSFHYKKQKIKLDVLSDTDDEMDTNEPDMRELLDYLNIKVVTQKNTVFFKTKVKKHKTRLYINKPNIKNDFYFAYGEINTSKDNTIYNTNFMNYFILWLLVYTTHHAVLDNDEWDIYVIMDMINDDMDFVNIQRRMNMQLDRYVLVCRDKINETRYLYSKYSSMFNTLLSSNIQKYNYKLVAPYFQEFSKMHLSTFDIPPIVKDTLNVSNLTFFSSLLDMMKYIPEVVVSGSPLMNFIQNKNKTTKDLKHLYEVCNISDLFAEKTKEQKIIELIERSTKQNNGFEFNTFEVAHIDEYNKCRTKKSDKFYKILNVKFANENEETISSTLNILKEGVEYEDEIERKLKVTIKPDTKYLLFEVNIKEHGNKKIIPEQLLNIDFNKFLLVSIIMKSFHDIGNKYYNYNYGVDEKGNYVYYKQHGTKTIVVDDLVNDVTKSSNHYSHIYLYKRL